MGIFNFFIVIPEILASLFFGWVMNHLLGNNRVAAVVAGGFFMAIAAALMQRVVDRTDVATVRTRARLADAPS
jgi:maltose/moltooligosaccharide transporter